MSRNWLFMRPTIAISEAEFGMWLPFFMQCSANSQAGASDQTLERVAARRGPQALDDFRLDAGIADHRRRIT
jgi:hypothetical protein